MKVADLKLLVLQFSYLEMQAVKARLWGLGQSNQRPQFRRLDSSLRRVGSKDLRLDFRSQYSSYLLILNHSLYSLIISHILNLKLNLSITKTLCAVSREMGHQN